MAMTLPTVTAVSPTGGPPVGGTLITITGTNFTLNTTSVTMGGTVATNVTVTSSTTLTANTPPGTLGSADIVVHTPAGDCAPLVGGFVYARTPVVSDVVPTGQPPGTAARGSTIGGTAITILGTDFHPNAAVLLGGLPAENVVVVLPSQIDVTTPLRRLPLVPGGVEVLVRNPDDQSGSLNPGFEYFLLPAPTLIDVNPRSGSRTGGTTIEITGTNFQTGVDVFIGSQLAHIDISNTSSTLITALTPELPSPLVSGPADVRVVNPDGQAVVVPGGFIYTP
jgi:large repetitive protein